MYLAIIFIVAFIVRLIGLNQSLWLDEATTARVVQQYSFSEILTKFSPFDFHPPLYYFFMKVWTDIFGYSEIALRMPSVLFSLLTGYLVYRLVREDNPNYTESVLAVALFLFNPLVVYYSQEARMYSLVTMFTTLIFYYLLRINGLTNKQKIPAIYQIFLCNLFMFLSLVTFYGPVFFIVTVYLYLLFKKQFRLLLSLLPGSITAGVLLYPLFVQQLKHSGEILQMVPNWSATLGQANLKNLLLIPLKFSIGRISFGPKILYYSIAGLWTLFVFYFVMLNLVQHLKGILKRVQDDAKLFLYSLFFIPIILGFALSFYKPLLQYFRFLYVIPFMAILLAKNATRSWQRYTLISGFILFSLLYLLFPIFHREDWKSLAKSLPKNATVFMIPSSSDPIAHYRNDIHVVDIQKARATSNEIIVIPYTADIHGVDYKNALLKKRKQQVQVIPFRGLVYEVWR